MGSKISELTALTTPVAADLLVIVDTTASPDTTKKITITSLSTILAPLASPTFTGTVTTGLLTTNTTSYAMVNSVNTALTRISGGTSAGDNGAQILLFGSGHANTGRFAINTSGVGSGFADTERLQISGGVATAVATWASVTHTGLVITSAGLVEGAGTGANGFKIKNPKNAAATALSGTQLDVEIDIGGTPYYFTVYPTKA